MLEILEFIFGSFWRWAGTAVLVSLMAEGLGQILHNVGARRRGPCSCDERAAGSGRSGAR